MKDEKHIAEAADEAMANYLFHQKKSEAKAERQNKSSFVSVDVNSVATSESRSLGPELVGHSTWNQLEFNQLLNDCGFTDTQQALAEAVVVGRLVAPSSDLASWRWLREKTALIELLPVNLSNIEKDAIYEIADALYAHKTEIERGLRINEANLFSRPNQVFLYDLTNTYFEGSALKNEFASRRKSSQIYEGNKAEPDTLEDILKRLEEDASLELINDQPMINLVFGK